MKLYIIILIIFASCNSSSTAIDDLPADSIMVAEHHDSTSTDTTFNDYENYYIVIADTGRNYYILKDRMCKLSTNTKIEIDSMGRYYNKAKNLIALSDNDSDEMYRGQYHPRRFPSTFLSLEYLDYYRENDGDKTIALVAGIFETKHEADSVTSIINRFEKKVYSIKARVFTGCMH